MSVLHAYWGTTGEDRAESRRFSISFQLQIFLHVLSAEIYNSGFDILVVLLQAGEIVNKLKCAI